MQIAILGMGNVGGKLAQLWEKAGHNVGPAARGKAAEAVRGADAVALCVPGTAVNEALDSCGDLTRKILIDCTNPLTPAVDALVFGGTDSNAERIQARQPGAYVVKAFNSIGAALFGDADFGGQRADGFFCGDHATSKTAVSGLIRDAGLNPVDVGPLRNARYLEALAMLWIDLALHQKRGPSFAFKILAR